MSMVITPSPCLKVKQAIEHPGQFSVGTTLKNWSIFGRRQQGSGFPYTATASRVFRAYCRLA